MMFWYGDGMHWWGYGFMAVGMILFWGVIIFGIVALVRYAGRRDQPAGTAPVQRQTPEQVLAERYARGRINGDEYQDRLSTLRGDRDPAGTASGART